MADTKKEWEKSFDELWSDLIEELGVILLSPKPFKELFNQELKTNSLTLLEELETGIDQVLEESVDTLWVKKGDVRKLLSQIITKIKESV